jgi:CBS domain-containing protein
MRVQDLMSQPVVTCHVTDSLNTAARLMWDRDCGAVAVVSDDGTLVGMLTDRDICMAAYTQGRLLVEIPVNTAMAKQVFSAQPDQKLGEVEQLMADNKVHRIPVVDGDGKPIGLLSLNDLAIESVQPETQMKNGPSKIARTLAAICQPRTEKRKAA